MKYIREDESQVKPLVVAYFVYPWYFGEKDPDFSLTKIFNVEFDSYEEASSFAMLILKSPDYCANFYNEHSDSDKLTPEEAIRLRDIESIEIMQELLIMGDESVCVDCPTDYIRFVGRVYKEGKDDNIATA